MGIPSTQQQLKIVSTLFPRHESLQDSLELHKKILQIQLEIDNTPTKGTTIDWDKMTIDNLQQKSLEAKKPIIQLLDPTIFDLDFLFRVLKKVIHVFIKQNRPRSFEKALDAAMGRNTDGEKS